MSLPLRSFFFGCVLLLGATARAATPTLIPTFHNVSVYWTPEGSDPDRAVSVRYRALGSDTWRDGLALPHNALAEPNQLGDYRGTLPYLAADTEYEVELGLEGTSEREIARVRTWSEYVPEGATVTPAPSSNTLVIEESGTADGYRIYDGGGQVFDLDKSAAHNVDVRADYVVLRNFVFRGARSDAIRIRGRHHVIVESCDISDWGSLRGPSSVDPEDLELGVDGTWGHTDAAVATPEAGAHHIVVQRNRIHDPTYRSNTWEEGNCRTREDRTDCNPHPYGPVAIRFSRTEGRTVVRYNEIFAGPDGYYGDIFTGNGGVSWDGYGPDSDIYGNYIANCWDDGLELEGGVRNLRVYRNYITHCYMAIANAPVTVGPLYVFHNVIGVSERSPGGGPGAFIKMGTQNPDRDDDAGRSYMRGYTYVFHNTMSNPDASGPWGPGLRNRPMRHVVTRNNIFHVPDALSASIGASSHHRDVDFDFDLVNRPVPDGSEPNGIVGTPIYVAGAFDRTALEADYRLAPDSLGVDAAERLPGFNDRFEGDGPDLGAHETNVLRYGPEAEVAMPGGCANGMCGTTCDEPCETACVGSPLAVARATFTVDGAALESIGGEPITLSTGDASAHVEVAWDDERVFVRATVMDPDVRAHVAAGEEGDVWRDDAIEVFLDPDGGESFDAPDLQLIVNAAGATFTSRDAPFEASARVEGTPNDDVDDDGYVVELALPFAALGFTATPGARLGFDVALNDRARPDDGTAGGARVSSADWAELDSYRAPSGWCALRLDASPDPPADAGRTRGDGGASIDAGPEEELGSDGCSCSTHSPRTATAGWLVLALGWLGRRRRAP